VQEGGRLHYWTLLDPYTLQVSETGSYITLARNKPTLNNELLVAEPKI
jgi:hypothetical protein